MSTLGAQTALYAEDRGLQVPMALEHGPVTSSGKAAPGPDPRIRHRTQIGMFRPIRMDHTNCLQVAIKTLQFLDRKITLDNKVEVQDLVQIYFLILSWQCRSMSEEINKEMNLGEISRWMDCEEMNKEMNLDKISLWITSMLWLGKYEQGKTT